MRLAFGENYFLTSNPGSRDIINMNHIKINILLKHDFHKLRTITNHRDKNLKRDLLLSPHKHGFRSPHVRPLGREEKDHIFSHTL